MTALTWRAICRVQDVYFVTRLVDSRCLLVLEYIVVERRKNVPVREVSVGWSALPTVQPRNANADAGALVQVRMRSP